MAEWRFLLDENVDPKVETYLDKAAVIAEHVRDELGEGADDEELQAYARAHDLVIVTSDVKDFGALPTDGDAAADVVLLHDDTMPAYRIASALITMSDAYASPDAFPGREDLDAWT